MKRRYKKLRTFLVIKKKENRMVGYNMFGSQKKKKTKLNMEILMKINGMAILGKDTDEAKLIAPKRGEKSRKKMKKNTTANLRTFFYAGMTSSTLKTEK